MAEHVKYDGDSVYRERGVCCACVEPWPCAASLREEAQSGRAVIARFLRRIADSLWPDSDGA